MAFENPLGTNNLAIFEASTGLPQYTFVSLSTAGVLISPNLNGVCIGVLVSSGTTGSTQTGTVQSVQVYGVAKVLSGTTTITFGSMVQASTTGIIGAGAIAAETGNNVMGIAVSEALSTGAQSSTDDIQEYISVLLLHMGKSSTIA